MKMKKFSKVRIANRKGWYLYSHDIGTYSEYDARIFRGLYSAIKELILESGEVHPEPDNIKSPFSPFTRTVSWVKVRSARFSNFDDPLDKKVQQKYLDSWRRNNLFFDLIQGYLMDTLELIRSPQNPFSHPEVQRWEIQKFRYETYNFIGTNRRPCFVGGDSIMKSPGIYEQEIVSYLLTPAEVFNRLRSAGFQSLF